MREAFIANDRSRLRLLWVLAVAAPLVSLSDFYSFLDAEGALRFVELSMAISFAGASVYLVWGVVHRKRPIVELFDDRVEVMSNYQFIGREIIPIDEIASVSLSGCLLQLTKRSGEVVTIKDGMMLGEETRRRVAESIQQRIRARART